MAKAALLKTGLDVLYYSGASQVLRGIYWVVWQEKPEQSWLRRTLKLLGCESVSALSRAYVDAPAEWLAALA